MFRLVLAFVPCFLLVFTPLLAAQSAAPGNLLPSQTEGEPDAPSKWRYFVTGTLAFVDGSMSDSRFGPVADEELLGIGDEELLFPWQYGSLIFQTGRYGGRVFGRPLNLVAQVQMRELGSHPLESLLPEAQLNWAFAELRIHTHTTLRAGVVPSPMGLFNETRDVGSLVPFFRAPYSFYRDLAFVSRNVEGIQLLHTFLGESTPLEITGFTGAWDVYEYLPTANVTGKGRARDAIGARVGIELAQSRVKLATGAQTYNVTGGVLRTPGDRTGWDDWHGSFEAQFGKFISRSELRNLATDFTDLSLGVTRFNLKAGYVQLGYRWAPSWTVYGQFERSNLRQSNPNFENDGFQVKLSQDLALAVNYFPARRRWGIKAETHWSEGDTFVPDPLLTPEGPILRWLTSRATGGRHSILSFVFTLPSG